MRKHSLQWFTSRINKTIGTKRPCKKTMCKCRSCQGAIKDGVIIRDKEHAEYLFNVQNEMGISYFDK